ncbi:MAG: 4'-phosphopantetheinyl transferase superfamily protein [Bacteroides sp.]|nr:4'-phosphopantetheinyl transferase superfamily protein [Bacteroides sp.]
MNLVYFADINKYSWNSIRPYINILSNQEIRKILDKRQEKDQCLSLLGKMLLLHILKEYEDWDKNVLPELLFNKYGKPYIERMKGNFNISHSGNIVACGYSTTEVGIDIEEINPFDLDEFERVFNQKECNLLELGSTTDFYRIWTQKEALMKVTGKGFYLDPLEIDIGENLIEERFEIYINDQSYQMYTTESLDGYVLTTASGCYDSPCLAEIIF